jgi:DNA-binding NarL/FixJ family response regulator
MKKGKIKVYLIDDHALILEGLKKLVELEDDIAICGSSIDPSKAIREIERSGPDVAVVDISLKDMNGIDLVKTIRGRFPSVKLLVLSMHDENIYAERALKSGALGYVMKHAASDAVVDAIRTVSRGEVYLSEQMKKKLLGRIAKHPVDRGILPEECLSDREIEIFQMIGEGLPTREVARRLGVSAKTVEAHREHIKEKLDIRSANELVLYAVNWVTRNVR